MRGSVRVVKDTNFAGLQALARRLRAGMHAVLVGVPASAKDSDGTSLAQVAAINEFGGHVAPHSRVAGQTMWFNPKTGRLVSRTTRLKLVHEVKAKRATFANGITIPERPFLRRLGARRHLRDFISLNAANLIRIAEGRMTEEMALGRLGAVAVGKVKSEIAEGNFTPNAPSTVKAKGSSKPLVDSGQLRQSISWELDRGQTGPGVLR